MQWPLDELLGNICANGAAPTEFDARLAWLRAEFRGVLEKMEVEREARQAEQRVIATKRIEELRAQEDARRLAYQAELAAKNEKKRAAAKERRRLKKLAQVDEKTPRE